MSSGWWVTSKARLPVLTPKGWLIVGGASALLWLGGYGAYRVLAPMLAEQKAQTEQARDAQASAELEVEGAGVVAQAVEEYTAQGGRIVERTYVIREQALAAPDADAPLPADRADRLAEHDRFLCAERPVCGPTPDAVARAVVDAMQSVDAPDEPEAG